MIKKINSKWTDENNNSWDCDTNIRKEAEENSLSLVNCRDCSDCSNCSNCSDCMDCSNCSNCSDCSDCSDLSNCSDCIDCSNCWDCRNCSNLTNCSSCSDCSDLSYCSDLSGWETNPERIVSPKLGSEDRQTTIYFNEERTQVVCGCFIGTIKEFKKRIRETHKYNKYAKGYFNWLRIATAYIKEVNKKNEK